MKLIIPLAGKDPQYQTFKPFIKIKGKMLIEHIIDEHPQSARSSLVFIILKEHEQQYDVSRILYELWGDSITIRILEAETNGAPCSIIQGAHDLINTKEDILIELGDVLRNTTQLYSDIKNKDVTIAGIIPVQKNTIMRDRPWGYVYTKNHHQVRVLKEKEIQPQSAIATMGLYYFSDGSNFVKGVKHMIAHKSFVYKDAFFVGPVYNELIKKKQTIHTSENRIIKVLGNMNDINTFK